MSLNVIAFSVAEFRGVLKSDVNLAETSQLANHLNWNLQIVLKDILARF